MTRSRVALASALLVLALGPGEPLGREARAETVEGEDLWVIAPDDATPMAVRVRDAFPAILDGIESWLGIET